ncbi:MAG: hypothetical protein COX52_09445 [Syntrophobacterales bacterium CG23_combo_of_CG06-09_8_20_14_all_48_27]|nr:MAG: hypothetical protein COX52_09445 [Syntrophobacterales bacterium CG23_combo_of_CG06-09_8_20_14_all_48_27]PIZ20813.1 MAG: hypothetical protein COY50_02735 [Deltaproteobacteria bacterium CG_4_10_14_0_8_um_filter_43_12]
MEGIAKIGIERLLENFQSAGKSQLLTVSESSVINEKINNNMKEFKIEYKKIEFESKVAAEKIVLTTKI